jgi:methionyl aminopeptidase
MITTKTSEDIATLKEGGKRHAHILSVISEMAKVGVSTNALNEKTIKLIREGGDVAAFLHYTPEGAKRPYPAALCVSVNEEIVHGIPNENPTTLKDGDVVSIDLGLTHLGLITDAAVTIGVGEVSVEDRKLIEGTKEALYAGIKQARGGGRMGDIGAAIESVAKRLSLNLAEGLAGHGVGYEVHEDPYVPNTGIAGRGEKLVPGMVIAIEPMLVQGKGDIVLEKDGYTFRTRDGKKAAHFEHTVLITESDPVILTQ